MRSKSCQKINDRIEANPDLPKIGEIKNSKIITKPGATNPRTKPFKGEAPQPNIAVNKEYATINKQKRKNEKNIVDVDNFLRIPNAIKNG